MNSEKYKELRQKAKELLNQKDEMPFDGFYKEIEQLIEEYNTHQMELENQSAKLQISNKSAEKEKEKYKKLYFEAPVAYFTINQTGNIYGLNNAAAELIGMPIHVFNKTSIFPYLHKNSKNEFSRFFKKTFESSNIESTEVTFISRNNDEIIARLQAKTYFDEAYQETLCHCTVTDITGIKAYEQLKENENHYKTIFYQSQTINLLIDPETGDIFDANSVACQYYGYNYDELLSMNITDINILSEREIRKEMQNAKDQKRRHFLFIHRLKSGEIRHVEVYSKSIHVGDKILLNSIIFDIEDKVKAEKEVAKLTTAVKQSPASIVITDLDANIEFVNPKFTEITGYTFQEAVGKNPRVLKSGKTPKETYKELWATIKKGEVWKGEFLNRKKDGALFWEHATIAPIKNNGAKITNYIAVKEDITEKKEKEEKLKELNAELNASNEELKTTNEELQAVNDALNQTNETIGKEREQFLSLLNSIPEMIYVADKNTHEILFANKAMKEIFGRNLTGEKCYRAIQNKEEQCDFCTNPIIFGQEEAYFWEFHNPTINKDFYIIDRAFKWTDGRDARFELAIDVTEQKIYEQALKAKNTEIELSNERLESLLRVSQLQTNSIQELLDFALDEAIKLTGSKIGYIYYYNEENRQFILNSWSKGVMKLCNVMDPQTVYDLDKTGIWGEAVRQKRAILINNFQAENPLKKGTPEGHVTLKKYLTIPVFFDGKIVAVTAVANKEKDYNDADIRQLTLLMDSVWKISERLILIDDLQKTEENLRKSKEKYRLITENASDVIWVLNLSLKKFTYISPSVYNLRGYTAEEAMQQDIDQSLTPESAKIVTDSISEILPQFLENPGEMNKKIFRHELRQPCKDGSIIWIETTTRYQFNSNNEVEVIGISRNIEERKKQEERVTNRLHYEENLSKFSSSLLVNQADAINKSLYYLLKASDCSRVYIFENFTDKENQLYMKQTHEICDKGIEPQIHNPQLQKVSYEDDGFTRWKELLSQGKIISGKIKDFPTGEKQLLEAQDIKSILVIPLYIAGKWSGFIGFDDVKQEREWNQEDINLLKTASEIIGLFIEKKQQEEEVKNQNLELQKLNATKDKFFSIISHDLKNPFNSLLSFSEALAKDYKKYNETKRKEFIQSINEGVKQTYKLLETLLMWSRSQTGRIKFNPQEADIESIALDNIQLLANNTKAKNIHVKKELTPGILVKVDVEMLNTVFRNLITNAVKFTPVDGEITVGTKKESPGKVTCYIKDNGVGIEPKNIKKLFQIDKSFSTQGTKNEKGSGLGLILCKEFIEKHNGEIGVNSQPGKGSKFYFKLKTIQKKDTPGEGCITRSEEFCNLIIANEAIKKELADDLLPLFIEIKGKYSVNGIKKFTDVIQNIGTKHEISQLKLMAEKMNDHMQNFDIPKINYCFDELEKIFEKAEIL